MHGRRVRCTLDLPDGYYADAMDKSGGALKNALHGVIDGHTPLPYTESDNDDWFDLEDVDVWEALAYTDSGCPEDFPKCGKVRLLYLDETRDLVQAYRVWSCGVPGPMGTRARLARSRGFKEEYQDGYTDLHHIRPADRNVNNAHGNYGFGVGGDDVFDSSKGCRDRKAVAKLNRESDGFEPPDRAKGEVARMLFYMAVRYEEGDNSGPRACPTCR